MSHAPSNDNPSISKNDTPPAGQMLAEVGLRLNQAATFTARQQRPYVTLSYAQTLDGSITIHSGQPLPISNAPAHRLTHQLRAGHQAILVGINTVLADNPRLTVRLVPGPTPQPVILDSYLRCPLDCHLLQRETGHPWIMAGPAADPARQQALEAAGARVFRVPTLSDDRISLPEVLALLARLGIQRLMVEGGSQVITSFIQARLVDQLLVTIAPTVVGGLRGVQGLGIGQADQIPRLTNLHTEQLADNVIMRGDFTWPQP